MEFVNEITGLRSTSTLYHINDGYFYTISTSERNTCYLKCRFRGCSGRATMPLSRINRTVQSFRLTNKHNHDPDHTFTQVQHLREAIFTRCAEETHGMREIFQEECAKVPVEVASQLSFSSMKSTMWRTRKAAMDHQHQSSHISPSQHFMARLENNSGTSQLNDSSTTNGTYQTEDCAIILLVSDKEDQEEVAPTPDQSSQEVHQNVKGASPQAPPRRHVKAAKTINPEEVHSVQTETADVAVTCNLNDDLSNLKTVMKKLEAISDKMAASTLGDSYDQFGKYISSLLRGLPPQKVLSLKQKMVSDVLDVLIAHERRLPDDWLSNDTMPCATQHESATRQLASKDLPKPASLLSSECPNVAPTHPAAQNSCSSEDNSRETPNPALHVPGNTGCRTSIQSVTTSNVEIDKNPNTTSTSASIDLSEVGIYIIDQPSTVTSPSSIDDLASETTFPNGSNCTSIGSAENWPKSRKRKGTFTSTHPTKRNAEDEINIEEEKEFEENACKIEVPSTFEAIIIDDDTLAQIKEEVPDIEESGERPGCAEHQRLVCDLCPEEFTLCQDVVLHFTQQHSGCIPSFTVQEGRILQHENQDPA